MLDHPRRAADRTEPPLGRDGLPGELRQRVPRVPRQDRSERPTIAELLRPHGYRNYLVGKWHVTRLTETGPTGPFDGWPLGRGFDRYYGFLDAETDQYSPEVVRDNTHVTAPGDHSTGYHLTTDLIDEAIGFLAGHEGAIPDSPWFLMLTPGACHAPHQAPRDLIDKYAERFEKGWDQTRDDRLARQIELGIVPAGTTLPPRNLGVRGWDEHTDDEHRLFARLAGAYGAMLEHFDQQLARLIDFIEQTGSLDDTIVLVLSDNGASQEGGPLGFVNAMGPFNMIAEPIEPTRSPASTTSVGPTRTPTSRTAGRWRRTRRSSGTSRTPTAAASATRSWCGRPTGSRRRRSAGCATSSATSPTSPRPCSSCSGIEPCRRWKASASPRRSPTPTRTPARRRSTSRCSATAASGTTGYKAVAFHAPTTSFDDDVWELYDLANDFNENHDLAADQPERLAELQRLWWARGRGQPGAPARRPVR